MKLNVKFKEVDDKLNVKFGETKQVSDGGYEKGLADGYEKGNKDGYESGYGVGVESGKKLGNEEFWEAFTKEYTVLGKKIERTNYQYSFQEWMPEAFTLSKTITPQNANRMFYAFNEYGQPFDLVSRLNELGVEIDFSMCTDIRYAFANSYISTIPTLNLTASGLKSLEAIFNNSKVETVEKIILKSDGTHTFATSTFNAPTLKNITFEGVVGTDIEFNKCAELSKASITSIMRALSTTASGKTVTFSKQAVENAFYGNFDYELNEIIEDAWGNNFYVGENVYFGQPIHIKGSIVVTHPYFGWEKTYKLDNDITSSTLQLDDIRLNFNYRILENCSAIYFEAYDSDGNFISNPRKGSLIITADGSEEWELLVKTKTNWTINLI